MLNNKTESMLNNKTVESQEIRATSVTTSGVNNESTAHQSTQAGATAVASGRKRKRRVANPGAHKAELELYLEEQETTTTTTTEVDSEVGDSENPLGAGFNRTRRRTKKSNKAFTEVAETDNENPLGASFSRTRRRVKNRRDNNGSRNKPAPGSRPGFSDEELDKFSYYSTSLKSLGFALPEGTSGRVFDSDTDECKIVRLDQKFFTGKKWARYLQTEGEGQWFFKEFKANESDVCYLVEGVFDALALYKLGYNAIAYNGVLGAFQSNKLHPNLLSLLNQYSKVIIGYDIDPKVEQKGYVEHHLLLLAKELEKAGKEASLVTVWEAELGKDFSAILAKAGADKLQEIVKDYSSKKDWVCLTAQVPFSPTDCDDSEYVDSTKLLKGVTSKKVSLVKAPKGAGKTTAVKEIVKAQGGKALIVTPLKVLGKQITKELNAAGLPAMYREDLNKGDKWDIGVCCVESLTAGKNLGFTEDGQQTIGLPLIIDEIESCFARLLVSDTLNNNRKEVISLFTALIRNASAVIGLSADATDFNGEVLAKLAGVEENQIYKYENTYKRNQFEAFNLGKPEKVVNFVYYLLKQGQQVFLAVDSQGVNSKYAAESLEILYREILPAEEILVFSQETCSREGHLAKHIIETNDVEKLNQFKLVIGTPTLEAGFSVPKDKYKPNAVVVLHMGATSPNGATQLSMRVRATEEVPRYFGFGGHPFGNLLAGGAKSKNQARKYFEDKFKKLWQLARFNSDDQDQEAKDIRDKLQQEVLYSNVDLVQDLVINFEDEPDLSLQEDFYKYIAISNLQTINRIDFIASKIRAEGGTFENKEVTVEFNVADKLETIREQRKLTQATAEFNAPNLTPEQYSKFKELSGLTKEQSASVNKFIAQKSVFKYDDVTLEDLQEHIEGLTIPETLLFWLFTGRNYLEFYEQEKLLKASGANSFNPTKIIEQKIKGDKPQGNFYKQDATRDIFIDKVTVLEEIGIKEALNYAKLKGIQDLYLDGTDKQENSETPIHLLCDKARNKKSEFSKAFGWTDYRKFSKNTTLFTNILKEIGYKVDNKKKVRVKDSDGKTRQLTIHYDIKATRPAHRRNKRFEALLEAIKTKWNRFSEAQLYANIGHKLTKATDFKELIERFGLETVLSSARRLPRGEFGLSKHSQILLDQHNFKELLPISLEQLESTKLEELSKFITLVDESNSNKFVQQLKEWVKNKTEIAFDCETYESKKHKELCYQRNGKWFITDKLTKSEREIKPGLDQELNLVRLMQFTDGRRIYVCDLGKADAQALPIWFRDVWAEINKLAKRNSWVGHNVKFDGSSIRKYGLSIPDLKCTLGQAKLAFGDCGASQVLAAKYGLKECLFNLLNIKIDKTEQSSNWGAEQLTKEQIVYAAKDPIYTLYLKKRLDLLFENPAKWGFPEFADATGKHSNLRLLNLENKVIHQTVEMQFRGVPVNIKGTRKALAKAKWTIRGILKDWKALGMKSSISSPSQVLEEINKRYLSKSYPFDPVKEAEKVEAPLNNLRKQLAVTLSLNNFKPGIKLQLLTQSKELVTLALLKQEKLNKAAFPIIMKSLTQLKEHKLKGLRKEAPYFEELKDTSKDTLNDNPHIPELALLKSYRSYNNAIQQLSKVLLSAEVHGGVCKTEYGTLSGTGRLSCGNKNAIGAPNLQAFMKKAKANYFNYNPEKGGHVFWRKPAVSEVIKIRKLFKLNNGHEAFFTEDANASHARLAVGFGKCEFGRKVQQDSKTDAHSMFAVMALQAILETDSSALDSYPEIRDFVKNLSEEDIKKSKVTKQFKSLDLKLTGGKFRDAAKTLFYSVLNGAQAEKMRKVLSAALNKPVSGLAGEIMFSKFWSLYKGIAKFIENMLKEAEENELNLGGLGFNLTTLPDGTKLVYARKNGTLATSNLIACQWSRSEATALKKLMLFVSELPKNYGAKLINMVHDEIGITCLKEHWQCAYSSISDKLAEEYDVYLQGFVPSDEPTEVKLHEKLFKEVALHKTIDKNTVKIGDTVRHYIFDKNKLKVEEDYICKVTSLEFGKVWTSPDTPYVPTSWADK